MLTCDLIPIPESFDPDERVCRACAARTAYALDARDYLYTYPTCPTSSCREVVQAMLSTDISRAGASVSKKVLKRPWSWFGEETRRRVKADPFL